MEELIIKYLKDEITSDEKDVLFDWVDLTAENQNLFKKYSESWNIHGLVYRSDEDDQVAKLAFKKFKSKLKSKSPNIFFINRFQIFSAAASIVLLFGLTWFVYDRFIKEQPVLYTSIEIPLKQRLLLNLADGSKVWLNSGSKFSYPMTFNGKNRLVKLDGEGYFEVAHDAKKPFIVSTSNTNIKVLGTKFNVFAYSNNANSEITLLEGKVGLTDNSTKLEKVLLKGQSIQHQKNIGFMPIISELSRMKNADWIKGYYDFENVTFREMIIKLSVYYKTKIIIQNTKLLELRFSGKFKQEDLIETILEVIKLSHPFNFKKQDNTIIIY